MTDKSTHLSEEKIMNASIDMNDLSLPEQKHIEICDLCSKKIHNIVLDLEWISKRAKEYTPIVKPDMDAIIQNKKWTQRFFRSSFKPALSMAIAVAIIFALFVINFETPSFNTLFPNSLTSEIESDEKLFNNIEDFENYALAGFTDNTENYQYFEDGFLEFITPVNEQNGQTSKPDNNNNGA